MSRAVTSHPQDPVAAIGLLGQLGRFTRGGEEGGHYVVFGRKRVEECVCVGGGPGHSVGVLRGTEKKGIVGLAPEECMFLWQLWTVVVFQSKRRALGVRLLKAFVKLLGLRVLFRK